VHLEPVEHALPHRIDEVARLDLRVGERVAADEGRALEDGVVELARLGPVGPDGADERAGPQPLAAEFRRDGGRTAFLSNSGPEMMARVRTRRPLEARFDAVVISCEVGLSKPDPRIYELCLERLALPAASTLFVDDRADNVEGAARIGLRTLQFEGPDALERLRALIR